jgi:hypothetical protein
MEIAVGFHSLTTTNHPLNVNLPTSGQQVTAPLSAHKVSVTGGNRAQDPLVRDTTILCTYMSVEVTHLFMVEFQVILIHSVISSWMTLILVSMVCRDIYKSSCLFHEKGKSEKFTVVGYRMEHIYK